MPASPSQLRPFALFLSRAGKPHVVFPLAFLVATCIGLIGLGMIFYLRESFHATESEIGWFSAMYSFSYGFACVFLRPLFDSVAPQRLILLATSLMFAFVLGMVLFPSFRAIMVLQLFYGLAMSTFWPPLAGWLSGDLEGPALGKLMARFNLSWSVGAIVAPFLCGCLSGLHTMLPMWVAVVILGLCALFIRASMSAFPQLRAPARAGARPPRTAGGGEETLYRYPAWLGIFLAFAAVSILLNLFPIFARQAEYSKQSIGLLLTVRAFAMTAAFVLMGRLAFWHFRTWPLLASQMLMTLCLLCLAWVRDPWWMAALFVLVGLSCAYNYASGQFHGLAGSSNRAQRIGVNEAIISGGVVSGAVLGGLVFQNLSYAAVFYLASLVSALTLLTQAFLCRAAGRERRGALRLDKTA